MDDLGNLVTQPEGQYFDRKSMWHGPPDQRTTRDRREVRDEIAEYVAAFANAEGGALVLGVENDGTPTGHGYPEDVVDQMLEVPRQRIHPPQGPGRRVSWEGRELLVFEVQPAERAVMVTGNGFPRRVHEEVVRESEEAINAIKARGRTESIEGDAAPAVTIDSLDIDLIRRAQEGAGLSQLSTGDYLCERRLADYRGQTLVLRKGALLLFGKDVSKLDHPNAGVRIFRVSGVERLTGSRHNVEEIPRVEGPLPQVIERAHSRIAALVRRSTRLHDLFFREMPEYPTFAWQEALINAVAHRDYRQQGRSVEVWLFEDRMEVISPGRLVPEVDVVKLRRREPVHCSRNPRIARVLAELALMREQGEGIPRMFEEMEQSWLRLPELRSDTDTFTVVLRNRPILEAPDPEWVRYVQNLPISQRQRRILVAYPVGRFTNSNYRQLNDVDRDVAYRELRELAELGLITPPEGRGQGARYGTVQSQGPGRTLSPKEVLAARMRARGIVQNADYREVFGINRTQAKRELSELVTDGVLRLVGRGRGAGYLPGPEWEAWLSPTQ